VARLLLEAYYEPRFPGRSHGFRKGRGCHTALREIRNTWTGTTWFIEGDISGCFGSLDHEITAGIMAEKIHDQRFLRLIRHMLKAGYLEDWEYHDTLSGVPQGGVASPVLSSIYLNKLDEFVERELIPRNTRGASRKRNPEYMRIRHRRETARRRGDRATARDLTRQMRTLPPRDPMDPGYRRQRYSRYADDHLLGFTGPKAEAEQIKAEPATFLRETLRLDLNQDKTLISHARTQPARFPGYHIIVQHCDTRITHGRRPANGRIALRVPPDVIRAKIAPYRHRGKPWHPPGLQNLDAYDIVRIYGAARQARAGPARVGRAHRHNAAQDPHRLRGMPRAHPRQPPRARGISRRRARRIETVHTGSGGRLHGKGPNPAKGIRDLAVQPTLRHPNILPMSSPQRE
jgi:hypothetical protein